MDNFIDTDEYEKEEQADGGRVVDFAQGNKEKPARPAFAYWEADENTRFQLKLTTAEQLNLEKKFRRNLISLMGDDENLPPLTTMLQVIHAAATPWQHGIKFKNIVDSYERYVAAGGNQLKLYVDVYLQVFMVSGFFSTSVTEDMTDAMEKMQDNL